MKNKFLTLGVIILIGILFCLTNNVYATAIINSININAFALAKIKNFTLSDSVQNINFGAFNNSSIALIMGEAGTGKTELLCNYYVNIFKGMKILFISNTHTCKNNMIRRVKEKSEWYDEKYEAKTASSISKNKYFFGEYDLVIIDECKSISNRDINEILKKINTKYLILAGDIGQIDAIDLGNWFDIATQMLDNKDIFVLTENYRTNSDELRNVWKKVRNKEADTLEYLLKNNYIEMINSNIFNKTSDDEIILCLNYNFRKLLNLNP